MKAAKDAKLLIVDDEPDLREAIAFNFRRKGFQVLTAADGEEALKIISKESVDVVLSDVRMPNINGIELLDKIKEANHEKPVVILITGFADIKLEDAYDKGAEAVFPKPFDRNSLHEAVMKCISTKDENWAKRPERFGVDLTVEIKFSEVDDAIKAKVLNIGRGGMFVALPPKSLPRVSQQASFKIEFTPSQPLTIEGGGVVRWVRAILDDGRTIGCGVEFVHLTDRSRSQVIELINSLKTKAFIPKN